MDPITITVSVISAVAGILTTYKTGRKFYREWKAKKKAKKAAEAEVEDSLEVGPMQIDNHCTQLSRRHGRPFEQGDDESRASLLRISLDLNQSLVDVLRGSLLSGRPDSIEPQQLWTASEQAQKRTIIAMIDLAQRVQVAAPIPRQLMQTRRVSGASDASNLEMVLHPTRSRATATPFDTAIPTFAIDASHFYPNSDSESVVSLQLTPTTRPSSALSSISASSSFNTACSSLLQSTPFLLPPIFPNTDGRSTSDLLREWKEDLNARSPLLSPNSPAMTTGFPSPRGNIKRYSSAPTTPSLNLASRPNRMSVRSPQPSPSTSGASLGLGIQNARGNRMSSQRVQSDSYVPSSLASSTQEDVFPTTSLHKGFTHSLQNSAGLGSNQNGRGSGPNG